MHFKDNPLEPFRKAIEEGALSDDPKADNWAGHYMYMGTTDQGEDLFKDRMKGEHETNE